MMRSSFLLLLLCHSSSSMLLGWVESPGYPSGYPPHATLNWSRCAPEGHILSLKLIHLDLEDSHDCENDALKVYSGEDQISILCGTVEFEELESTVNPLLISPSGGCLKLLFQTDYSNPKRYHGFRGFYTIHDFDECEDDLSNKCTQFCHNFVGGYRCSCHHGYQLAEDKHICNVSCSKDLSGMSRGEISSPSWPDSYPENANCLFTLSVEPHRQLVLRFSAVFDVQQGPDSQCKDALRIVTQTKTLGPFCGNKPPPSPISTHSNQVQIYFTSDETGENKGFRLHFETIEKVCQSGVIANSKMTPHKQEYKSGETVTVICDVGYVVNSKGALALSTQFETTCQTTGSWFPSYSCEIVDCGLPQIESNSILELVDVPAQKTQYNAEVQFMCSSEYYKLKGHDTYTCNATGQWVSPGDKADMPKCIEVCGVTSNSISSSGRILGGARASLGQIPWQLLIKSPRRGGASLINDQWAVTAAHVVDGVDESMIKIFGELVDGQESDRTDVLTCERIIIHPGYEQGISSNTRTNYDNDIALIRFKTRVNLGPNICPICLPDVNRVMLEDEQGTVSGWGGTDRYRASRFLLYAHISVYSLDTCRSTPVLPKVGTMIFTKNMLCAGADGKDSCGGDSGGPFILPMLSPAGGPYHLAGIVSWGAPCKDGANKGYYTKVQNYIEWIKNTIKGT
ncbi:complement C1s subcomponent [Oryzias melastigma]|uniref:Complement C1s subcomponent-like n=1 Tax=Oryzias melastigma TaxID=30732 RepID=A0A3B3C2T0_ORYME|nr:complement C1s subcomponent [Oryzias melastigma]